MAENIRLDVPELMTMTFRKRNHSPSLAGHWDPDHAAQLKLHDLVESEARQ